MVRVKSLDSMRKRRMETLSRHKLPIVISLFYPEGTRHYNMARCSQILHPYGGRMKQLHRPCWHKANYRIDGSLLCELHAGMICVRALADYVATTETMDA
jgi:hypothetical protein